MKRIFTLILGALSLVAVALISAFIAMRLAIHGREAVVPQLTGQTVAEASKIAGHEGLQLTLENRFYSAEVPAGRILAQDPASGSRVRREWPVRITESLGAQRVNIPELSGESERAATVNIRRLSLELGVVAHLAVPGDPDIVLSQTPAANSGGVDSPRVSLLVSDPDSGVSPSTAYVTPSLVGLSYSAASARAASAGLQLVAIPENPPPTPPPAPAGTGAPASPALAQNVPPAAPEPIRPTGIVIAQTPQPGRRIVQGDAIHVTVARPAALSAPNPAP
ncbi:MAG TPA: PASTA domain-containing protein [Acidobacteriaceae bacterium]